MSSLDVAQQLISQPFPLDRYFLLEKCFRKVKNRYTCLSNQNTFRKITTPKFSYSPHTVFLIFKKKQLKKSDHKKFYCIDKNWLSYESLKIMVSR